MNRYRKVDPRFWKDEKVVAFSPEEKLIALYLFTGQSNRIGLFSFSPGEAAEDVGMLPQTFAERFRNVCRTLDLGWDETFRVLYLPTWWKYNPPENSNNVVGNLKDLDDVPKSHLIDLFRENLTYLAENLRETFTQTLAKRYPQRYPKRSPSQEQEQEQEQEYKNGAEAPVSISSTSKKKRTTRARTTTPDPRLNTLLSSFKEKYQAAVGSPYPATYGKDNERLKTLLASDYDVPAIESAMDSYFASEFYGRHGRDVGKFVSAFAAIISAGTKQRHNFDGDPYPSIAS